MAEVFVFRCHGIVVIVVVAIKPHLTQTVRATILACLYQLFELSCRNVSFFEPWVVFAKSTIKCLAPRTQHIAPNEAIDSDISISSLALNH